MRLGQAEVLFTLCYCYCYCWLQVVAEPTINVTNVDESADNRSAEYVSSVPEVNATLVNSTTDVLDYVSC